MASKLKKHRAVGDEEWMSHLSKFAAVGVWPSEARNTGRHPARESGMDMYLKVNLVKVMCVQSYNIKLCHIERGHIFMIHCQTILQIVKCPVQLRGQMSLFGETQTCSCVFHTRKVSTIFS